MTDSTVTTTTMVGQIIRQALNAWANQNKNVSAFFNKYEDAAYSKEVAPGRNRAIYLLGHLIAANDGMLPMFDLGERLFPQYELPFLRSPDKTVSELPDIATLKENWETLNVTLSERFNSMSEADWMARHTLVSEADFASDPLRNKLNVLMGPTVHQSYHMGQLNFLDAG